MIHFHLVFVDHMLTLRHWDDLSTSPAKTRPRQEERVQITGLQLLAVDSAGRPSWPAHLDGKFHAGHFGLTAFKFY